MSPQFNKNNVVEVIKRLFSFKGKMNRKSFFFVFLIIFVLVFIFTLINQDTISFIIWSIATFLYACNTVKRLHDLNKPGWHYWLSFIPIYNIYFAVVLFTRKGKVDIDGFGTNRSNANPNNFNENKNIKKIIMRESKKAETFDLDPFDAGAMFFAIIFWIAVLTGIGILLGGFW